VPEKEKEKKAFWIESLYMTMDGEALEGREISVDLLFDFSLTRPVVLSSKKLIVPVLRAISEDT